MHESHTLIIIREDEGEEVLLKKFIKNTEEFWGDEKNSSVEVIELLEIPIGSPKSASCSNWGKYDTSFSAVAE